ncbi:MFS transporter [Mesotoga sp. Brook.08.YT.4.2.5.1]|jgi:MFS family permease|uniref:MFS transporter n=1 Tax=unclassified Mesotoga TaxID=1184398 RepID=UPI000C1754D4|nr:MULTISPECIES: MFS transporter [unclassified Mesotoga]RAM58640.1 MFS transporter [Mesotoga sp. SC_4PWL113PWK15]PNE19955.1 MFS transporter [Mesotoga sp. Brook.08.YT.4.2.5.1]PVD17827.1 hypothetical protein V512_013120 [Mesotoga sp. Brook.08.105.5.1]RAO96030.1 hypothetical protein M388_05890 [Mesotoga sp. Brook.08.YT.4.2.5.4.]RDI93543.1 MFS transporter [Mesotoga sp. Brook.08.YT.4.2.5.2.]
MDDYLGYNKPEYRRTRRRAIFEGSFFNMAFLVTQGFIVTGLALEYGASEMLIAIIGVLPTLAQLVQLLAPFVMKFFKDRKKAMLFSALIGRIPLAFIPVTLALGIKSQSLLLILLSSVAFGNSLVGTFWASIMGDVIDPEKTGKYFGRRNLILSLGTMLITPLYSFILDRYTGSLGFVIVTSMASVFAVITIVLLKSHYAPPVKTFGQGRVFKEVFANLRFRQYLKFAVVWNFAITISGPFYAYHQLVNLEISYSYLSVMSIVASLASMMMYVVWGKISDQIGHQSVAEFGVLGATILALMWIFVTPQTAAILIPVDAVVTGVVWSAINLCVFTMMMGMIRGHSVESYVAVQAFLNGLGALAGSLLGGFVASYLKGKSMTILGVDFYGIQVIFLLGSFFRFMAFLLLKRVQTTKIKTVPQVFFNVMSTVGRRMATRPYEFPMLQLRPKKRRPEDEPLKLDLPASLEDTSDIEENTSEEPKDGADQEKRSDS